MTDLPATALLLAAAALVVLAATGFFAAPPVPRDWYADLTRGAGRDGLALTR